MPGERPAAVTRFRVPQLDRLIEAATGEQVRIRARREGQHADQVAMPRQFPQQRPLLAVPQPDDGILAATGEQAAIGTPRERQNPPARSMQASQVFPAAQVPYADGSIKAPTDQLPSRTDGDGANRHAVLPPRPDGCSTLYIPEPDGAVP